MIVGIPREIKNNENRVAITPAGVDLLSKNKHQVLIETQAGVGSGISDEEYEAMGAEIVPTAEEVFKKAEIIVKVKEPLKDEPNMLRAGQILFTYLHLAPLPDLTQTLLDKKIVGIAYETVKGTDGSLPLLAPMSEVAGRLSIQIGAHFLEKRYGGRGILLGGVTGTTPAEVVVIGGGIAGTEAAKIAIGAGAHVTILDVNVNRLHYLSDILQGRAQLLVSNPFVVREAVKNADLLIGAVLIPGSTAPKVVTEEFVKQMKKGSVIVDIAIDQGGCVATSEITSHDQPVVEKFGVLHYGVPNMPGAVARTSTYALTNSTLSYLLALASLGVKGALEKYPGLYPGVNIYNGHLTCEPVAKAQNRECTDLKSVLK